MANTPTGLDCFEHVVVLMLENRSFDNLLGYLYKEGELPPGQKFEGLAGKKIQLPVPKDVRDFDDHKTVAPHVAENYHQPYPDPGEVYQHVNTQLFNQIDTANQHKPACAMTKPYNLPSPTPAVPPMDGFITDYVNTLWAIKGKAGEPYKNPAYEQYNKIMQCYSPEQVNVLSTLAKSFAVFDHWYCSVPSQTWCNRAFWHAAASGGKVVNPVDECTVWEDISAMHSWAETVWKQENIFQRMKQQQPHISHRVYTQEVIALTSLINGPFRGEDTAITDRGLQQFKADLQKGQLRQYSFVEPKFLGVHNDQHPSSAGPDLVDGPTGTVGTVLLGEALIWEVYNAIFTSSLYADNTLLIITYDEHGGCFDHVPPPAITGGAIGEKDFAFNRLGVRVPMVMVSAYIQPGTIMTDEFEHCSFISTLCKKWGMPPLNDRDANARTFEKVFSGSKRSFPPIPAPVIPPVNEVAFDERELNDLQASLVKMAAYTASRQQAEKGLAPLAAAVIPPAAMVSTNGEARAYLESIKGLLEG